MLGGLSGVSNYFLLVELRGCLEDAYLKLQVGVERSDHPKSAPELGLPFQYLRKVYNADPLFILFGFLDFKRFPCQIPLAVYSSPPPH